tara:strand:+ start:793 stop:1002 length:210 start_codon:yes stop_codon:yes gene_type:complete
MANDKCEEDEDSFSKEDELSDEEYEEIQQRMYNPRPPETECRMCHAPLTNHEFPNETEVMCPSCGFRNT